MSPLTKLFVVLLVVLSLLNTAATVVFVNQVDNYKVALDASELKRKSAENGLVEAQQATAAARALAEDATRTAQAQVEQARQGSTQISQHANQLEAQAADLSTKLALAAANETRLTEALNSSQQSSGKKDEIIAQLRGTNDERQKQNFELNTAVTDLTDKLQVAERDRKFLAEQLTEAKATSDKQGALLQQAGINPVMAKTSPNAGAPAINGVIRARRQIEGMPYATISVGSNDGVAKGMVFKIVNRETGDYLGDLTVDSVDAIESTGRLSGPKVGDVKPGVEVKTQL